MTEIDPFSWVERFLPARRIHSLIRIGALALFTYMFVVRFRQRGIFVLEPLWLAETALYATFFLSYALRTAPVDRAKGWRDIVVPIIGGMLPFALLWSPESAWYARHRDAMLVLFWAMTAGTALTVWAVWTLRRAFSITVEARVLVTGGPYRFLRHPIYLGEILTAGAVCLWRVSTLNVLIFSVFMLVQLYRARREEQKLGRALPGYSAFASRSRWLWRINQGGMPI